MLFSEKRVSDEEEEAGRRILAASEGETGDWIRTDNGIGMLLVIGEESEGPEMG